MGRGEGRGEQHILKYVKLVLNGPGGRGGEGREGRGGVPQNALNMF